MLQEGGVISPTSLIHWKSSGSEDITKGIGHRNSFHMSGFFQKGDPAETYADLVAMHMNRIADWSRYAGIIAACDHADRIGYYRIDPAFTRVAPKRQQLG